jgi:transposase-like protein
MAKNTRAIGRHESSKKNSPVIHAAFAMIQKHTAKLWLSSARSLRLRRAISIATVSVGTIIAMPSQRHPQHQQESLKIQSTIWAFSYSRAVLNGFNLYVLVEIDATYVGGMYDRRRKREPWQDKPAVAGLVQRDTETDHSKVIAIHVAGETKDVMIPLVEKRTTRETNVFTDDSSTYYTLRNIRTHDLVVHSRNEYVRGNAHTNSVENFWSNFKRGVIGSFHQVSIKHLQRYLDEFQFRFNNRQQQEIFAMVLLNLVIQRGIKYKTLTGPSVATDPDPSAVPF